MAGFFPERWRRVDGSVTPACDAKRVLKRSLVLAFPDGVGGTRVKIWNDMHLESGFRIYQEVGQAKAEINLTVGAHELTKPDTNAQWLGQCW